MKREMVGVKSRSWNAIGVGSEKRRTMEREKS